MIRRPPSLAWIVAALIGAGCTIEPANQAVDAPGQETEDDTAAADGTATDGAETRDTSSAGCAVDAECDDGDPCTIGDACGADGVCVAGDPPDCDDGVACTEDACFAAEGAEDGWACTHPTASGSCLIDDLCYAAGEGPPGEACSACVPAAAQDAWSDALSGTPCLDGDGVCSAGACVTIPAALPADMVFVPAGTFWMGCDADCTGYDEGPLHEVWLDDYAIDRYEVTAAEFTLCVDDAECEPTALDKNPRKPTFGQADKAEHPMNHVSWAEAKQYCEWKGRRLCTEAEWEKAARGTDARTFPWGEDEPDCDLAIRYIQATYEFGCGAKETWPVGSVPEGASPWGVYDMAGNVWEFVADYYDPYYYGSSPPSEPLGPLTGESHIVRGGGWKSNESDLTTHNRWERDAAGEDVGIRCCASAP